MMNTAQAREIGSKCAGLIKSGKVDKAEALLVPVLAERTPFRLLDMIGDALEEVDFARVDPFLERIAALDEEGSWVVIASVLRTFLGVDLEGALHRCQRYIVAADAWYAADSLAERVPGEALVGYFNPALTILKEWRGSDNQWIRRAVGVSVHFWAKRSRGEAALVVQALQLLDLLEPLYTERKLKAVKGIGWGLKTLGRNYPELVEVFLERQIREGIRCRTPMIDKAKEYLPQPAKDRLNELES